MRPPKRTASGARTLADVLSGDIDPKVLAATERIWAGFDPPDDSQMQERLDAAPELLAAVTAANSTPEEDLLSRPRRQRRVVETTMPRVCQSRRGSGHRDPMG